MVVVVVVVVVVMVVVVGGFSCRGQMIGGGGGEEVTRTTSMNQHCDLIIKLWKRPDRGAVANTRLEHSIKVLAEAFEGAESATR